MKTLLILLSLAFTLTLCKANSLNSAQKQSITWALNTPAAAEKDVQSLGQYLGHVSFDDYIKALTIMCWIVQNVEYDYPAYIAYMDSGKALPNQSPDTVLHKRLAVCQGYAEMYQALCREVGLKCELVVGYAKGWGYHPGDRFPETDHAWNAVNIYGKWELVDATWGDNDRPDGAPEWFYFCASPRQLISSHLPANPKWQLLGNNCSKSEFEGTPQVFPSYYAVGLEGYFPNGPRIQASSGTLDIKLKHGRPEILDCSMYWESASDEGKTAWIPVAVKVLDNGVVVTGEFAEKGSGYVTVVVRTDVLIGGAVLRYRVTGTGSLVAQAVM